MQPVLTASIYAPTSTNKQSCFSAHRSPRLPSSAQQCQSCWLLENSSPTAPACQPCHPLWRAQPLKLQGNWATETEVTGACTQRPAALTEAQKLRAPRAVMKTGQRAQMRRRFRVRT